MRKLTLHIGSHKTGSTSLQKSLEKNVLILNKHGYSCASSDTTGRKDSYVLYSKKPFLARFNFNAIEAELSQAIYGNDLIISSEHFFLVQEEAQFQKLNELAKKYFDGIDVLLYLRRQDELALSFKAQASKVMAVGNVPSSLIMGHSLSTPYPEINTSVISYLDYKHKINMLSNVFGENNIYPKIYARDSLIGNDICLDFFDHFGIKDIKAVASTNVSFSAKRSTIANYLLLGGYSGSSLSLILDNIKDDGIKVYPSIKQASTFFNFLEDNYSDFLNVSGLKFNSEIKETRVYSNYGEVEAYRDELAYVIKSFKNGE